jgi:hydroxymethylglutaryl-CoA lyase
MQSVKIVEVGPRDGLQNIQQIVPTEIKVQLIRRLAQTGLSTIEVTSFVSPKWIPQLADAQTVMSKIHDLVQGGKINFPVLVPNVKGLDAAARSGAKEVAVFVSATEGFSQKNTNCSIAEALARAQEVIAKAKVQNIRVRAYISCIFACPYDGPTQPSQVIKVVKALLDAGCYEISLGDTIGVGTPADVEKLLQPLLRVVPADRLAGHFHDTYGQAVANVLKSYEMGLRTFDSSVAGLGGCPYAKGAKGNLASEDVVYALQRMGIPTGVNLEELVQIGAWISKTLNVPNGSRAGSALATKIEAERARALLEKRKWHRMKSTPQYTMMRRGVNVKIVLTRPKNGNALTLAMIRDLTQAFKDISVDPSIWHVIVTGQGKYFCTGMDLGTSVTADEQYEALLGIFEAIDLCPKTTIAAINGPCFGGGIGLAFVCDIRLTTEATRFTLSEARLGLCPAIISKYVVREWGVGFTRAAMLTARDILPAELLATGALQAIAKDTVDLDVLLEEYLDKLRFVAPGAAELSKTLARQGWENPGGKFQAKAIKDVFDDMMAVQSESTYGLQQFRKGIKSVDWESTTECKIMSKL